MRSSSADMEMDFFPLVYLSLLDYEYALGYELKWFRRKFRGVSLMHFQGNGGGKGRTDYTVYSL